VRRTALVHAGPLSSPLNGARLAAPPLLRWKRSSGASYYNVQLWAVGAHGSKKVLSIWPTVNHLQLTPTWSFSGKNHKLTKGLYRWYVWPGIGPLALAHYGKVIGTSSFLFLGP